MPVIRTMYDLGPGGISTPDYDAQLALQRQIAGQNAQAQAFNQAMAMHQGSFSQRQEMAKMAMQRELYEAAQAADKERLAYDRGEAEKRAQYQQGTEQYRRDTLEQSRLDRIAREGAVKAKAAADQAAAEAEQEAAKRLERPSTKEMEKMTGLPEGTPLSQEGFEREMKMTIEMAKGTQGDIDTKTARKGLMWQSAEEMFSGTLDKIGSRELIEDDTEMKALDSNIAKYLAMWKDAGPEAEKVLKELFATKFRGLPNPHEKDIESYWNLGELRPQMLGGEPWERIGEQRSQRTIDLQADLEEAVDRIVGQQGMGFQEYMGRGAQKAIEDRTRATTGGLPWSPQNDWDTHGDWRTREMGPGPWR